MLFFHNFVYEPRLQQETNWHFTSGKKDDVVNLLFSSFILQATVGIFVGQR